MTHTVIFLLMRKVVTKNDAPSQAVSERRTKRFESETDLFPFSMFWIADKKPGNTGAEK
jgi:hypothetical protein